MRSSDWSSDVCSSDLTLAATIIVAVLSLVDLKSPAEIWRYSRTDFAAMMATIFITLIAGVESGVIAGVGLSLALYLWRSEEHTSELQSLMRISYAVFCLKKKTTHITTTTYVLS